jgi:terminase small subunit-like protein
MSARIGGRPSSYKSSIASAICRQVREGGYLKSICQQEGMPSLNTVYRWREQNEAFAGQFAVARGFHADTLADKIRETIDGAEGGTIEQIQARRLKFDGYRYLASKYFPRVYGDKMLHTGGDGEGPVAVKLSPDYSRLEPHEMLELKRLVEKAERPRANEPLMIEGAAEDDDGDS